MSITIKISLLNLPETFSVPQSLGDQLRDLLHYFRTGEIHAGSAFPPLGLLYLASVLKEAGYEVSVLDAAVKGWNLERVEKWVRKEDPEVLGLSTFAGNLGHVVELARRVKEARPELKIILGGPQATFTADPLLRKYSLVDLVVRGEAEEIIVGVLRVLEGKEEPGEVRGISYRVGDKVVHNPPAGPVLDLDSLPRPDRSLLGVKYSSTLGPLSFSSGKSTTVLTSRGCPYRCTFCSCMAFRGSLCKFRSPENVVGELEELEGEGYEEVGFVDDSFTLVRKRVERICELMRKRKLNLSWWCESRVDAVSLELFREMKRAGCEAVFFGLESGSQRILDYYQKRITPEQSVRAVEAARRAGLNTTGTFIVGAPVETREEVLQTLRFAGRLKLDAVGAGPLWVYPGTPLWGDFVSKHPGLGERYWESGFAPVELGMCAYSEEWLLKEIGKTLRRFYLNPLYFSDQLFRTLRDPYRRRVLSERLSSLLS